jgi:hypothetical protein
MRAKATPEQLWMSYQELGTLRAVAERHGYAHGRSLGLRLRAVGYHPKPNMRASRAKVSVDVLWSSYQELGSLQAVAERHGYANQAPVWRRLRLAGFPLHPKNVTREGRDVCPIEELIEVFQRTQDYHEVARLVSSTYNAVKGRLYHAGYTKRSIQE